MTNPLDREGPAPPTQSSAGIEYRVTMSFAKDGPTDTGVWKHETTARRAFTRWIGLYGSDQRVRIALIEEADGGEQLLATWADGRVVV